MKNIVRNAYAKFQRATLNSLAANRNQPKPEMRTTATRTRPTMEPYPARDFCNFQ